MKQSLIAWVATAFLVIATTIRALDYSHSLDLLCTFAGCGLWAYEGYLLKSAPLMLVNIFSDVIIAFGFVLKG